MKNKTRLTLTALFLTFCAIAQSANENLFKKMITNLPNYQSVPGTKRILTIHEFNTAKPVNWTMEYGNNPGADNNTKV